MPGSEDRAEPDFSHPQNVFGGYYTTNILIANNVFYSESGTVNGLDLDSVTTKHVGLFSGSGVLVANNTMSRALSTGVYVSYNAGRAVGGVSVRNNIFDGITGGAIAVYYINADDVGTWDSNLYGSNSYAGRIASTYYATAADIAAATAHENNGIDADPDLSGYVPRAGSPAVGSGTDLSAFFIDDFTGSTRVSPWDIGAHGIPWTHGNRRHGKRRDSHDHSMTRFLAFLALCWSAFSADGGALLIITEATARGHAGPLFDKWVAQIAREGNFSPVIVREHQRWTGSWATNDWPGLNAMSNDIVRINPSAVQLYGHFPGLSLASTTSTDALTVASRLISGWHAYPG